MAKIVHFEIPADDVERAKTFYTDLFGWKIENCGGSDYWMIKTDEEDEKACEGGMMKRQNPQQQTINYIDVPSVSEYMGKVESLGGKVRVSKTAVPGIGYFAVCTDTENNSFGLWRTDPDADVFSDEAEVFAALMSAVIAVDGTYSVDEMRMVWNEIETMEIFSGRSYGDIEAKVFGHFDKKPSEPTPFDDKDLETIMLSAKKMLGPELRLEAYRMAVKIAHSDKNLEGFNVDVKEVEQALLDRIKAAFEIAPSDEQKIMDELKPKF